MVIFNEFLSYIQNFIEKFNAWIDKNVHTFQPDPKYMNSKYIELSRPYNPRMEQDFVEYNHVVDEILQISPPYVSESPYAPKYSAPEIKPGGEKPSQSHPLPSNTSGIHKILYKPEPGRNDLMPLNDFSKSSFGAYPIPEYKNSNSFDSLRDGLNSSKNIEINRKNMKGIAHVINNLQTAYNIDDDAPKEPPSFKADSLFKNFGNSNNPYILKQENSKGNSLLDLKQIPSGLLSKGISFEQNQNKVNEDNKAYSFLKDRLGSNTGFVKLNVQEFQKDDDD